MHKLLLVSDSAPPQARDGVLVLHRGELSAGMVEELREEAMLFWRCSLPYRIDLRRALGPGWNKDRPEFVEFVRMPNEDGEIDAEGR
jgi:hypothetical protein